MRGPLIPIHAHNDRLEPVREGYSLRHKLHGWWWSERGWVIGHATVKVFDSLSAAAYAAGMMAGAQVTTVPRTIGEMSVGPLVVWTEVSA